MMAEQLYLDTGAMWLRTRDGNPTALAIFLKAEWRRCGMTKGGLRILERLS